MRYKRMKINNTVFTHNITFNCYKNVLRNICDRRKLHFKPLNHVRKCIVISIENVSQVNSLTK